MKVLQVFRTYFPDQPGGTQEVIRQIALNTAKHGIETRIYVLSPHPFPSEIEFIEAKVFRTKSWFAPASCDIGGLSSFKKFIELSNWADIINYHYPWPFFDLLHMFRLQKKPTVLTYHSDIVRQNFLGKIYSPLMRKTFNSVTAVVATSPIYAQTSNILNDKKYSQKLKIIPLGISENTNNQQDDQSILLRLNIKDDNPYFLFVGVLRYYKGLHTLIEAAKFVDSKIVIVGSGPEEMSLKLQVKNNNIQNVIFTGQVSEKEKNTLLKNCYAFVLPSHLRSEAFGVVLIEAAMYSKPIISCEIGTGTSFVNINNETGLTVPPLNSVELANAMKKLIANDSLARQFGLAARRRYENLFSGEVLGRSYANLYKELLKLNGSPDS